jgi:hypothetical protein
LLIIFFKNLALLFTLESYFSHLLSINIKLKV